MACDGPGGVHTVAILLLLPPLLHPFNGLFSRTPWVGQYQKGKTSLDLHEARDDVVLGWQWHQLDHVQTICTLLLTDNHTNASALNFYWPDALPDTQLTVSKHWRHVTPCYIKISTCKSFLMSRWVCAKEVNIGNCISTTTDIHGSSFCMKPVRQGTLTFMTDCWTVLWCCWLGSRKGTRPVKKTEWWGTGMVISLERDADLHMAQLMPLPLTVSCFSKIQIGFAFLVPAHPGSPGKRAVKRVCVCACVRACVCARVCVCVRARAVLNTSM